LNTLGIAQFRTGKFDEAAVTLARSHAINSTLEKIGKHPGDLAFLAMSLKQLGRADEANARLDELRKLMQQPKWSADKQALSWWSETERRFDPGEPAKDERGNPLNLDFESGTLDDWKIEGDAFTSPHRYNGRAALAAGIGTEHQGEYWLASDTAAGARATGTATSAPFVISAPFGTFLVGGGEARGTRVEIVRHGDGKIIATTTGGNRPNLAPVILDLSQNTGQRIYVRVIDEDETPTGVICFDNFRFHATRPAYPALVPPPTSAATR
jgi:hypothetical protein